MAATMWGRRAQELYRPEYARQYRAHDEQLGGGAYQQFCEWLGGVCDRFDRPIDALDLGCGTGRYFRALRRVRSLVGIDASAAMLAEARTPLGAGEIGAGSIALVEGDVLSHDFRAGQFDLVYSIGVLAEHTPFDRRIVANVHRWLRPGGRFAFTTVHPNSPTVPRTVGRVIGRLLLPITPGALHRRLHRRLTNSGLYADEELIASQLSPGFTIETLARMTSESHLHCLCVARRVDS